MKDYSKKNFYVLECEVENCDAEFYFNDIPIIRRGTDHGRFYKGQSNQYVVDGLNEIAMIINPGPTPKEAIPGENKKRKRSVAQGASARAKLALYPFGAVAGGPDGKELMSIQWKAPEQEQLQFFPRAVSTQADLGPVFGKWEWEDLPRIELNDTDLEEIKAFLEVLHQSLAAGDPEFFIEFSDMRLKGTEQAYLLPPGDRANLIRQVTQMDAAESWWGMQPLDPENFDFRLCAQDRLVECIAKDWQPVLKENPDDQDGVGTYYMLLGKVFGEWHIVL